LADTNFKLNEAVDRGKLT